MELDKMKNSWRNENDRIENSIRINKTALLEKMRLAVKDLKQKNLLQLGWGSVFLILIFSIILYPQIVALFRNEISFYVGVFLLLAPIIASFWMTIAYNIRLHRLDITETLLETQKKIGNLEIYRIKMIKSGWIRVLCVAVGLCLISGMPLIEASIAITIALLIVGGATFGDIKYRQPNQFRELKSFLTLLEEGEKDENK